MIYRLRLRFDGTWFPNATLLIVSPNASRSDKSWSSRCGLVAKGLSWWVGFGRSTFIWGEVRWGRLVCFRRKSPTSSCVFPPLRQTVVSSVPSWHQYDSGWWLRQFWKLFMFQGCFLDSYMIINIELILIINILPNYFLSELINLHSYQYHISRK